MRDRRADHGIDTPKPWRAVRKRDPSMAGLLDALFRFRSDIMATYPRVRIFGRGGDLAAPVGAPLLLWERWDKTRGFCPQCGADALGVSFGGLLTVAAVSGCCIRCVTVVTRHVAGIGVILNEIEASLEGTPYHLPLSACAPEGGALLGGWGWALGRTQPGAVAVLEGLGARLIS